MINKKILIVGSRGGIGSDLVDLLISKKESFYETVSDITDKEAITNEILREKPDIIIHLAAMVGTIDCEGVPRQAIKTNVEGTLNIVEAAKKIHAKLVYFSTTAIYKPGTLIINEDSPIEPQTIYGKTKYWGEEIAKLYMPKNDLLIIRPCFGFGGRTDVSMLGALIRSHFTGKYTYLLLDLENYKDYTYVRNITNYLYVLMEKNLFGDDFNISQGEAKKYKDVLRALHERNIIPFFYNYPEYDYMGSHIVSNNKIIEKTNVKPLYSFEKGLDILIKEYNKK
jgi:dTDP-4-dehydrorhamnose reductase